jgi:hypothetical protein
VEALGEEVALGVFHGVRYGQGDEGVQDPELSLAGTGFHVSQLALAVFAGGFFGGGAVAVVLAHDLAADPHGPGVVPAFAVSSFPRHWVLFAYVVAVLRPLRGSLGDA